MRYIRRCAGIAVLSLLIGPAIAVTRYVSTAGNDVTGDGSISNPFATIQKGINESALSGDVVELADGTYWGIGNTFLFFQSKSLVLRSTSGTPQACIIDGQNTALGIQILDPPLGSSSPVIEGITIQNCVILGSPNGEGRGGAIIIENSSPTIRNCIIANNSAFGGPGDTFFVLVNGLGGAIYAFNSFPIIENCSFVGNSATGGNNSEVGFAGIGGGGAYAGQGGSVKFVGCSFSNNTATGGIDGSNPPMARGGAVYIESGSVLFEGCSLSQNSSIEGGGAFVISGSFDAVNSVFVMNAASSKGGAVGTDASWITLVNCSLANNSAGQDGGGVHVFGGFGPNVVDNSVIWGNSAVVAGSGFASAGGAPSTTFRFSLVQGSNGSASWSLAGGTDGGSNLDTDPGFLRDPGTLNANDLGDLRLSSTSICVDSGSNALIPLGVVTDQDGEARIFNGVVDRGAYEFQASPALLINDLKADIDALVAGGAALPAQGRGLKATLNVALFAVNNGFNGVAVLALNAFQFQCNALVFARRLTRAQADALIAEAEFIIGLLE